MMSVKLLQDLVEKQAAKRQASSSFKFGPKKQDDDEPGGDECDGAQGNPYDAAVIQSAPSSAASVAAAEAALADSPRPHKLATFGVDQIQCESGWK